MKNINKKIISRRILSLALSLLLLLPLVFSGSAFAKEGSDTFPPSSIDNIEVSDDSNTITLEGVTYKRISKSYIYDLCGTIYVLPNYIRIDGSKLKISYSEDLPGVLFASYSRLVGNMPTSIYATDEGIALINEFKKGKFGSAFIQDYQRYKQASISQDLLESLIQNYSTSASDKVDVTELEFLDHLYVYTVDKSGTLVHERGVFYDLGKKTGIIYIDYDSLDNSYFDSNGNFSFRQGSVPVYLLTDIEEEQIRNAEKKMASVDDETIIYIGEEDDGTPIDRGASKIGFIVLYVIGLFIVPLILTIIGFCLCLNKKRQTHRRWLLFAIPMALSLVIFITLFILFIL